MATLKGSDLSATCGAMAQEEWEQRDRLPPSNPDISGPGVLTSFLGTASLTITVTGLYYFLAFNPSKDPFHNPGISEAARQPWVTNSVDKYVFDTMAPWRRRFARVLRIETDGPYREKLERALNMCVLSLSDAQTLTGIAVLVSMYGTLNTGIRVYHWRLAVYFAWYANITHQSSLLFLRGYLNEPQRHFQRRIRLGLMVILTALLIAAMVPTGYFNYSDLTNTGWTSPAATGDYAWCFVSPATAHEMFELYRIDLFTKIPIEPRFHNPPTRLENLKSFQDMITSIVLLLCTFASKTLRVSPRLHRILNVASRRRARLWYQKFIRNATGEDLYPLLDVERRQRFSPMRSIFVIRPLVALYITGHVYAEFLTSMMSEMIWLILSVTILSLKTSPMITMEIKRWGYGSGTKTFEFGQILPIMLLAGPLLVIVMEILSATFDGTGDRMISSAPPVPQNITSTGEASTQAIESSVQSDVFTEESQNRIWKFQDHPRKPGTKWVVILLILQAINSFIPILFLYVLSYTESLTADRMKPVVVWYFITLPSAAYFMVIFTMDARGNKMVIVPWFLLACAYFVFVCPTPSLVNMFFGKYPYLGILTEGLYSVMFCGGGVVLYILWASLVLLFNRCIKRNLSARGEILCV